MSISVDDLEVRTRNTLKPVSLKNLNIRIEDRSRLALLSPPDAGLNLVIDALCGANAPEGGRIARGSTISWPLPSSSFLHKHQTFIANARFIACLYGVDQPSFISKVIDTADVAEFAHERVDFAPRKASLRFAFALGACLPFDFYLFTNTNIGDRDSRDRYAEIIRELGAKSGLIVATSSAKAAEPFCDTAFVIDREGATYYEEFEAAAAHLERITKRRVDSADDEPLLDDEERVFDDFF